MNAHDLPPRAADLLERIRSRAPRVHCLMNTVVQKFVADGLSALGARPSMTSSPEEIRSFVRKAEALTVNLGTLDAQRRVAIDLALAAAAEEGKPWALDPAHCDYSPPRAALAQELLSRGLAVLRANAAECALLAPPPEVATVRSGETDLILRAGSGFAVENGHPLTAKVTGTGCLSGALIAAFCAVEPDPLTAAASATLALGAAAEIAAEGARGPGSFEPALLDALHALTPSDLLRLARIRDA